MNLKSIFSFIGITLFILTGGLLTLILLPQPLFSNSYEYQNFTVYSNYEVSQGAFNKAIDEANKIVKKSELYDPEYSYDLFLADKTLYNKIDDLILGKWSVARAIDNNITIKRKVTETESKVKNGDNQFDLVYVLVHEMIHCLQDNKYGKWTFNPLHHPPYWKLEGYPEYMGRRQLLERDNYTLKKGIKDFLARTAGSNDIHQIIQTSEKESTPYIYYKGRLMVEYLMDIKGLSYDEILADSLKEELVYSEMLDWYRKR